MEDEETTQYIKDFLDKSDDKYEEVNVVDNVLYVRCPRDSDADLKATVLRRLLDFEWSGKVIIEYLDGTREELYSPDFGLELDFE